MKYIKYSFLLLISIFSFFISDKILLYVESLNPVMQTIKEVKENYEEKSVDALIEGNTIIPGKKGKKVNERESYLKMKDFKTFNETFLIFDYVKPLISLEDNLDKIIIKGNSDNKVSLIVSNNNFDDILLENKIEFNKIIEYIEEENENDYIEYININKINKNKLCIVGYSNIKTCQKRKNYLIMPSLELSKENMYKINNIKGGDIILISKNLSKNEFNIFLNKIKSKDLGIIKLSKLISE